MVAGGNAPAGAMRAERRAGCLGAGAGTGAGEATAGTMVIGGGAALALAVRGAVGFFLAAPSAGTRRVAATGARAFGSSGTDTKAGAFGGVARRGKAGDPRTGGYLF